LPDSIALLSLVLGSSLASSLFFVLSARILREAAGDHAPSALGVVGITQVSAALFLLPFLPAAGIASWSDLGTMASSSVLMLILLTAVLHLAARFFHFKALSLADVSLVSPFAAVTPVLTVFTSWMILGERLNPQELAGILIVVVSLLGLTGAANAVRAQFGTGSTLVKDSARAGLWFAFLSAIPPAFKIAVQKKAIVLSSPFTYALIMLFLTGAGALLFCAALTLGMAAGVSAMARINIVIQGILAYWLAGQKTNFRRRILWAVAIFLGVLIIGMATP
jgi:drug/metabolite transporter (DMT)-like permease